MNSVLRNISYPVQNLRLGATVKLDDYLSAISRLEDQAKALPESSLLLEKAKGCRALVSEVKDIPEELLRAATAGVESCIAELEKSVGAAAAAASVLPVEAPGSTTWAYVGGIAAIAGVTIVLLAQ